jgi:hypothetical protein
MLEPTLTNKAILKSNDRNDFSKSNCCLTISVGQTAHEGDKLKAVLLAVSNKNFKVCNIIVGDTLQRHNLQITRPLSDIEANEESKILGKQWYTRNISYIQEYLTIPYSVWHWDYWQNHSSFNEKYLLINQLYTQDQCFKHCVDNTSKKFIDRNIDKLVLKYDHAFQLSNEYLLEECAGMLIWADDNIHFDIYPSQRNLAMEYVYKNVISPVNNTLVRAVSIKFKTRLGVFQNLEKNIALNVID